MQKILTTLSIAAVLVAGTLLALPTQAQTTDGRGLIHRNPATTTTDQSGRKTMMDHNQMSEMMENCHNMMRNMQGHQMPNQQGTGPTSPRSGN